MLFSRTVKAEYCLMELSATRKKMLQGLPQGSVLTPLLFLFYINGLEKVIPDGVFLGTVKQETGRRSLPEKMPPC